jgi:hypothetical protein
MEFDGGQDGKQEWDGRQELDGVQELDGGRELDVGHRKARRSLLTHRFRYWQLRSFTALGNIDRIY